MLAVDVHSWNTRRRESKDEPRTHSGNVAGLPSAHVPLHSNRLTVISFETLAPAFVGAMKNKFCVVHASCEHDVNMEQQTPQASGGMLVNVQQ